MAWGLGITHLMGISPTVFADRAALVRLIHGVHTFRLGTRRHCAQHFTIGFTATPLTWRHLRHKPMIRVTPLLHSPYPVKSYLPDVLGRTFLSAWAQQFSKCRHKPLELAGYLRYKERQSLGLVALLSLSASVRAALHRMDLFISNPLEKYSRSKIKLLLTSCSTKPYFSIALSTLYPLNIASIVPNISQSHTSRTEVTRVEKVFLSEKKKWKSLRMRESS